MGRSHGDVQALITQGGGATTTAIHYAHLDHLGGTNVVSNASGALEETISYYPFGSSRLDQKSGSFDESKKFTGHEYDDQTGLYYMQARYQSPSIGRFVSEDPSFLDLGRPDFKQLYSQPLDLFLRNPQQLNSYTYVNNNPVINRDPDGRYWQVVAAVAMAAWDYVTTPLVDADATPEQIQSIQQKYTALNTASLLLPAGTTEKAATKGVQLVEKTAVKAASPNVLVQSVENASSKLGAWGGSNAGKVFSPQTRIEAYLEAHGLLCILWPTHKLAAGFWT